MRRKFVLIFVLLISIGVVISGILSIGLLKANYEENLKDSLIENGTILGHLIETESDQDVYVEFINSLKEELDTRITLIDRHGVVVVDTEIDASLLANHKDRPEIQVAYGGEIGISKRYSNSVEKEMFYVALPVDRQDVKVVRLSIPLRTLTEYTDRIVVNILLAAVAGVILATLLGVRFLNMFTGPLLELTEATQKISEGNFGEQVYINTTDEIGQLAESFNMMSLELDRRIDELKESNMTNQAILKSMINGVIAVDNDANIMFINKAAQKMFNIIEQELQGENVVQAFKTHPLKELFNEDFTIFGKVKNDFVMQDPVYKVYKVFSNGIKDKDHEESNMGLLLSFVDITQMRQLENMRKDFVANVSHELKTPLTSIQGFIETLKEGAAEQKPIRDKFIDIIDIEASRLKHLIDDILVLSDIEKTTLDHHESDINMIEIISDISGMMSQISEKKGITVHYDLQDQMPVIKGNKVWLKQIFINLIDNGIKYTQDQGDVYVTLKHSPKEIKISIADNGIGIAPEHLDRLFERFYRVDKARSKKVGGTGLGLAIVKHIVLSMDGKIEVDSQVDKGTTFTIYLPR